MATIGITDPERAATDLAEARTNIDIAAANPDAVNPKNLYKLWETRASIYNDIANNYINKKVLDDTYEGNLDGNPAIEAFNAVRSGMEVPELKKWQTKELLKMMLTTANYLSNFGGIYYGDQDYAGAFNSFEKTLDARNILVDKGVNDFLAKDEEYLRTAYYRKAGLEDSRLLPLTVTSS